MQAAIPGIEVSPGAPHRSRSSGLERTSLATRVGGLLRWMACLLVLATGFAVPGCADVVLLHAQHASTSEEEAIRKVADLYGLNIHTRGRQRSRHDRGCDVRVEAARTFALLISADALSKLDRKKIQRALLQDEWLQCAGIHFWDRSRG